jgi:hypothetical protein
MWIFLSTILVLLVFSAGFRKGCLVVPLMFIGVGYYVWSEYAPHPSPSSPSPASSRAIRATKPSNAKNKLQMAEQRSNQPSDTRAPVAAPAPVGSPTAAEELRSDP